MRYRPIHLGFIIGAAVAIAVAIFVRLQESEFTAEESAPPAIDCAVDRQRCFETERNLYQVGDNPSEELRESITENR